MDKIMAETIRDKAISLGFEGCGILPLSLLFEYAARLDKRMEAFPAAKPMLEPFKKYADPKAAYAWANSVIVCTSSYGKYRVPEDLKGLVGRYYMFDHKLQPDAPLSESIAQFEAFLDEQGIRSAKELHGVTSGRLAAERAGLGVVRKNNFLFTKSGSRVIIDTWLIDKELEYREKNDLPQCPGGCEECIKACPTGSLCAPNCMNMASCVTRLTWGIRDLPPENLRAGMKTWLYGCDVCQDVCPFNKRTAEGTEEYPGLGALAERMSPEKILAMEDAELLALLAPRFWFIRPENIWIWRVNALRAMANACKEEYKESIKKAQQDPHEKVRQMADWAAIRCNLL